MPHATFQYPFEWKILAWAGRHSYQLTGDASYPFLILLGADGMVRQIVFGEAPRTHDYTAWEALQNAHPAWFFYDPFDSPEYTYIAWQGIPQGWFERAVGTPFTADDLTSKGQDIEFPKNWDVMF